MAGYSFTRGYLSWLSQDLSKAEQLLRQGMRIAESSHDAYIMMGYVLLSHMARQQNHIEQGI